MENASEVPRSFYMHLVDAADALGDALGDDEHNEAVYGPHEPTMEELEFFQASSDARQGVILDEETSDDELCF